MAHKTYCVPPSACTSRACNSTKGGRQAVWWWCSGQTNIRQGGVEANPTKASHFPLPDSLPPPRPGACLCHDKRPPPPIHLTACPTPRPCAFPSPSYLTACVAALAAHTDSSLCPALPAACCSTWRRCSSSSCCRASSSCSWLCSSCAHASSCSAWLLVRDCCNECRAGRGVR